jgi:hypothetical protein
MMDWISKHASEILVAIITAIIIKLIDYRFAKQSKVVFFYTNAAQFNIPGAPNQPAFVTHTITLALWNTGRAIADKVRLVHYYLPRNYQVWPPMATAVNVLPSGHRELEIPQILPNQIVYVSYLDFVPLTSQMIVQIEAKDHRADPMSFQFTKVYPQWVNRLLLGLVILGLVVAFRYLYILGTALLRFVR